LLVSHVITFLPTVIECTIQSEHARFVYNLQESETHSDDSDDPDAYRWDSDDSITSSSRRRRHVPKVLKKRMSILTNQYYDIPSYENGFEYATPGKPDSRRRFFQSVARWDVGYHKVVIPGQPVLPIPEHVHSREESLSGYSDHASFNPMGNGFSVLGNPHRHVDEDGDDNDDNDEASGALETESEGDEGASLG